MKLNLSSIPISIILNTTRTSREGGGLLVLHLLLFIIITLLLLLLLVFLVVVYLKSLSLSIPSKKIIIKNNPKATTRASSSYYQSEWMIFPTTHHHHHHHHHHDTTTGGVVGIALSPTTTHHHNHHHDTTTTVNQTMALHQDDTTLLEEADAKYAQELQLQEALLASSSSSILASQTSISTHNKSRPSSLSSLLQNNNIEHQMCNICLEKQEYWQMFANTTCSHSFCYDCTRKHATTKILENISTITCPELNCNCMLDFNSLRLIVPKHVLIKWDQVLCESTILESHKFYCPFADCSALLINDDTTITQNNCPVCKRSICAACHVPWHSEFTCKEFGKLNMTNKKGKKDYEKLAIALAKKNKWKKCPNCKFFVEKAEGCVHITCRCKYEFCYDCGQEWTSNHGSLVCI